MYPKVPPSSPVSGMIHLAIHAAVEPVIAKTNNMIIYSQPLGLSSVDMGAISAIEIYKKRRPLNQGASQSKKIETKGPGIK